MSALVIRLIVLERVLGGSYVALCWVGIDAVTTTSPFYGHTLRCFEQTTSERASECDKYWGGSFRVLYHAIEVF